MICNVRSDFPVEPVGKLRMSAKTDLVTKPTDNAKLGSHGVEGGSGIQSDAVFDAWEIGELTVF